MLGASARSAGNAGGLGGPSQEQEWQWPGREQVQVEQCVVQQQVVQWKRVTRLIAPGEKRGMVAWRKERTNVEEKSNRSRWWGWWVTGQNVSDIVIYPRNMFKRDIVGSDVFKPVCHGGWGGSVIGVKGLSDSEVVSVNGERVAMSYQVAPVF